MYRLERTIDSCLKGDTHTEYYTAFADKELYATPAIVLCSVSLSGIAYMKTGNPAALGFIPICVGDRADMRITMSSNAQKILTISIAAYNMEPYIRETLDSLIDERVIDDLEVFVVDDGGTDHTLEIVTEYAQKYPNSIFPIHKENGGYGTTVNYSMNHATGKYFKLLDGDDWFEKEAFIQFVSALKRCNEELIITPFYKGDPVQGMEKVNVLDIQQDGFVLIRDIKRPVSMWAITYKTQFLKSSDIVLPAHLLYTDVIFAVVPFVKVEKAYFLNYSVYCYRIGREGQSTSKESKRKHVMDIINITRTLSEYYESEKRKNNINLEYLSRRVVGLYHGTIKSYFYMTISKDTLQKIQSFEEEMHKEFPDIYYKAQTLGNMGKILTVLRKTNYLPYWLLKLIPGGFPYKA